MFDSAWEDEIQPVSEDSSVISGVQEELQQVWVMAIPPEIAPPDPWFELDDPELGPPAMVCRAVLEDGMLVVGAADPLQSVQLGEMLRGERCGHA